MTPKSTCLLIEKVATGVVAKHMLLLLDLLLARVVSLPPLCGFCSVTV